jgi:hypothetical protein
MEVVVPVESSSNVKLRAFRVADRFSPQHSIVRVLDPRR